MLKEGSECVTASTSVRKLSLWPMSVADENAKCGTIEKVYESGWQKS